MTRQTIVLVAAAFMAFAVFWWLRSRIQPLRVTSTPIAAAPTDSTPPTALPAPLSNGGSPGAAGQHARTATTGAKVRPSLLEGAPSLKAPWGGRPGELGRRRDPESNPEAPMAILASGPDEYLIVDQVNQRVQRFKDGKAVGAFHASETVQDIARGPDGRTILLDRLADKTVQVFDAEGKLINEAPIIGKGMSDGGRATGVFADEDGIYVERDHGPLVRIADARGDQDPARPELPGRPTRDGRSIITSAVTSREAGQLVVTAFDRKTLEARWSTPITLLLPIVHLLMLDSDSAGNVYVAADIAREGTDPPYPLLDEQIAVVRIGAEGRVSGSIALRAHPSGDEMQRPLSLGDDGAVYQMVPGPNGLEVRRYTFP